MRVGDLKKYVIDMSDSVFIEKGKAKAKMRLAKNDICFARTQATYDKLGNFTIIDELNEGDAISQHVSKIRPAYYVSSAYLVAYLNSKFGKRQMCIASYGDTRVELTHNQTKEIEVILLDDLTMKSLKKKLKNSYYVIKKHIMRFKTPKILLMKNFTKSQLPKKLFHPLNSY